jgi:hypothetical protein
MTKKELRQQVACEWLEQNYLQFGYLRHDIVTDRLQVRCAHCIGDGQLAIGERQELWRNLTDKDINTMVCQKPDTELLHEVAEMLEFADGLYISEITNKSMLIEDS